jgi:phosphoribosylanthranilate isomerase
MAKPLIKAGHLENLTDARYFAARDVAWLGFDLDENNEEAISTLELNAIKEWVEGPKIIAEVGFLNPASKTLLDQLSEVDGIQLSGFGEVPENILHPSQVVIREVVVQNDGTIPFDLTHFPENEILLFDLEKNHVNPDALGLSVDDYYKWLRALVKQTDQYILDVPFIGEELYQFVQAFDPMAIQLKGSEEEKIGFKSYDDIDAFFEYFEEWA